jgi:hypothetical protein
MEDGGRNPLWSIVFNVRDARTQNKIVEEGLEGSCAWRRCGRLLNVGGWDAGKKGEEKEGLVRLENSVDPLGYVGSREGERGDVCPRLGSCLQRTLSV